MRRRLPLPVVPPATGRGTNANLPNRFERLHLAPDPEEAARDAGERATEVFRDPSRSVLTRNRSPDIGFEWSVNPYRGCEHGCVYCLAPETPVLHEDLTWRPLGGVRSGDRLVGFDETPEPGRVRKLRPAEVEAVWWSRRRTLRLVTERTEILATPEHLWLQARDFRWSRTDRLAPGRRLRFLDTARPAIARKRDALFGRSPPTEPEPVVAVEPGPVADVVDIQTSTGTFYAAGLATHNCYARPTHEYLGFSAGLDFESRIVAKTEAPRLLARRLRSPRWKPATVVMSGVTDPYQPVERRLGITRGCLEVFAASRHPVAVITKSDRILRDLDLLGLLAEAGAVGVSISITTLERRLQRAMEPRAATPERRLEAIRRLAEAGVPVGVNVAPIIPGLTDHEIPGILEAARDAGARYAGRILLRLPHGVKELFLAWLERAVPERAAKVEARIRETRGGELYDSTWGSRMSGEGLHAELLQRVFRVHAERLGFERRPPGLRAEHFRRKALPDPDDPQLGLFR